MALPQTVAEMAHHFAQLEPGNDFHRIKGNVTIAGERFYSYTTPVARLVKAPGGSKIMLISAETYSNTTSDHLSDLARAMPRNQYFRVLYIGESGGQRNEPQFETPGHMHEANLSYKLREYQDHLDKIYKARLPENRRGWLEYKSADIKRYAATFGLPRPDIDPARDFEATLARREFDKTPEQKKKAAAARKAAREAAAKAAAEARTVEDRQRLLWAAGDPEVRSCPRPREVLFRLSGRMVETSQGVKVPLKDAIAVFKVVKRCHDRGEALDLRTREISPLKILRVGGFTVDEIQPNGDFTAGCHEITWAECERFARAIGVFDSVETAEQ